MQDRGKTTGSNLGVPEVLEIESPSEAGQRNPQDIGLN